MQSKPIFSLTTVTIRYMDYGFILQKNATLNVETPLKIFSAALREYYARVNIIYRFTRATGEALVSNTYKQQQQQQKKHVNRVMLNGDGNENGIKINRST